jgi:hypothetical protein
MNTPDREMSIRREAAFSRKVVALEMEYDSLANVMKQYKIDSVANSK